MIRKLAPDELVWFISRSLAFQGHSDPLGLAQRLQPRLHDPRRDAASTFVLVEADGPPSAGAVVRTPGRPDDRSLVLNQVWFEREGALERFLRELFRQTEHEAVYLPLHGVPPAVEARLGAALRPFGFARREMQQLRFELAETPPLGAPLVLEAWRLESDAGFREIYERAEGEIGDATWAWLKRQRGPFFPDLWLLARETLDQEPVGYAFAGTSEVDGGGDVDASYSLGAVGVLPEHRDSTRMLRRLVLSLLHELAGRSPLGRIDTHLEERDPKLIDILRSLGFEAVERYATFVRTP